MDEQQKKGNAGGYILSNGAAGQPAGSTGRTVMLPARSVQEKSEPDFEEVMEDTVTGGVPVEEPAPEITMGGVPVEKEAETQPEKPVRESCEKNPHRRKKPELATKKQKLALLIISMVLAFSLGLLAGVGLAFGLWRGEVPAPSEEVKQTEPDQMANHMPPVSGETEEPTEEVTEVPTEEVTEAPTEETTAAPTEEATEAPTEEATEAPTEEATEAPEASYLIAASNSRYLTPEDYNHLSDWELVLARNEIFARHGRKFANEKIQDYFNGCDWYEGTIDPEDFDTSVFNKYEKKNVQILKDASDAR